METATVIYHLIHQVGVLKIEMAWQLEENFGIQVAHYVGTSGQSVQKWHNHFKVDDFMLGNFGNSSFLSRNIILIDIKTKQRGNYWQWPTTNREHGNKLQKHWLFLPNFSKMGQWHRFQISQTLLQWMFGSIICFWVSLQRNTLKNGEDNFV